MNKHQLWTGLVFLLAVLITPYGLAQADHPVAYPLANQVKFDGTYTTASEWSDTSELSLEAGILGVAAYFSVKYDSKYLYSIWDFVECQKPYRGSDAWNGVHMYLDPLNKKTALPDESMYRIFVGDEGIGGRIFFTKGTSSGEWATWTDPVGTDISARIKYASSPHSVVSHMIVELRVPLTFADLKSHTSEPIGFAIYFEDAANRVYAAYPSNWNYMKPNSWGILEYSQVPKPQFSATQAPLTLSFVFVVATLAYHRRPAVGL